MQQMGVLNSLQMHSFISSVFIKILASVDNALLLAPGGFLTDNGFLSPDSVITTTRPLLGDSSSSLSTTSSSSALLPSLFASHILSAIAAKSRSSKPLLLALSLPRSVSQLLQDNNNNNEINNTNTTSAMDKENEEEDAGLKGARILLDEVMQSLRAPPFLLIN